MCSGIWRPIRLEIYSSRIADVRTDLELSKDYKTATIKVSTEIEGHHQRDLTATASIYLADKVVTTEEVDVTYDGKSTSTLVIKDPELWMPNGYGKQALYDLKVILMQDGALVHTETRRIGIRTVELVQRPDSNGKSFFFRVNGVDIFCGGSCWIPTDSFLTNVTRDRYHAWIELMVPANQKMIRVWGGGIYEDDAFYDACDEFGILVWQDFMFGCGNYPAYPEILKSIEAECVANLRRIRHHPCLAILAGNNEDYQVQESAKLTYDYADKNEDNWLKSDFPARYIYESLLPRVSAAEAPSIPYHPGSPWGDGKISSDPTV